MNKQDPVKQLRALGACSESIDFVRAGQYPTLQAAWDACPRGDWLLWLAGKKAGGPESPERKKLVLVCCEIAREVLPIFEKRRPDNKRVRECVETTEKWARGEDGVTLAHVRAKRAAAAAYAADAYAAASAAAADARKEMQLRCANIVRKHYPKVP